MKNILIWLAVVAVVLIGGFYALNAYIYSEKQADLAASTQDLEFIVGSERVKFEDGKHEGPAAPGSAMLVTTQYFGNEVRGDLDNDGDEDVVFLITQNAGGSGTFFYLVGAIQQGNGYQGTSAVLIGDRIAPQTTEFRDGRVIINYADRAAGEPMTAQPSVGKSLYLKYDPVAMAFGEVVQDFEGEADPSVMTFNMKEWVWTENADFALTFGNDGRFGAKTDCNSVAGQYVEEGDNGLVFSQLVSTKMYCEDSQEAKFTQMLSDVRLYQFTSHGELLLTLASGAEMRFR